MKICNFRRELTEPECDRGIIEFTESKKSELPQTAAEKKCNKDILKENLNHLPRTMEKKFTIRV